MLKLIFRALNVLPDEERSVALVLGHGFFMGVFLATYQTSAEALFVLEFPGKVSLGILAAGVLGVITTALFAFLQSRMLYTRLVVLNVLAIATLAALIGLGLFFLPESYRRVLIFIHFALLGPLVSVFLLGFWGIFGRIFNLRQSKRIIGGIDTGQLTAAILTFFGIALFLEKFPNLLDYLLFVSVGGALLSIAFLFAIIRSHNLNIVQTFDEKSGEKRNTLRSLLKDDYIMLLAAFLALSMLAYLFVENSYLTVLNERYSGAEAANQLATFISWFNGTILILSFIFQTFFNDRIIANYGLKISLLISPIILAGFTIVVIGVGNLLGYSPEDDQYFWFFLFMALSKLFVTFLKDALESPAFKLYFMPLDEKIRFDAQARVEGVVNEIARVAAGAIISLIALVAVVEIVHYSYVLVGIILLWIFVTGRLYNEYRKRIRLKLESQDATLPIFFFTEARTFIESPLFFVFTVLRLVYFYTCQYFYLLYTIYKDRNTLTLC